MNTTTVIPRRHTSFRLSHQLLEQLRQQAQACNCSLNSYVESQLETAASYYKEIDVPHTKEELTITPELQAAFDEVHNSVVGEYGTKDANGQDITPATNVVTFQKENTQLETVFTAEQAGAYAIDKFSCYAY